MKLFKVLMFVLGAFMLFSAPLSAADAGAQKCGKEMKLDVKGAKCDPKKCDEGKCDCPKCKGGEKCECKKCECAKGMKGGKCEGKCGKDKKGAMKCAAGKCGGNK